jgi:hypothetical protein
MASTELTRVSGQYYSRHYVAKARQRLKWGSGVVWIDVKALDAACVKCAAATNETVYLVALREQQLLMEGNERKSNLMQKHLYGHDHYV